MNTVDQFLSWFRAPASHAGWLDWFGNLSRGWKTSSPSAARPSSTETPMVDATNGQTLLALLDRIVAK